jgi:hypothetical protein
MLELLFTIMLSLAIFQKNRYRLVAALAFSIEAISHDIIFSSIGGADYYISAVLGSILVLFVVILSPKSDSTTRVIGLACIVSACLNVAGLVVWYLRLPPAVYSHPFLALYGFVVYAMCRGVTNGDRDDTDDSKLDYLTYIDNKIRDSIHSMAQRLIK